MKKLIVVGEDTVISGEDVIGLRAVEEHCLNVWLSDGSVIGIIVETKAEDVLKELIKFFIHDDSVAYAIENSHMWEDEDDEEEEEAGEKEDGICI